MPPTASRVARSLVANLPGATFPGRSVAPIVLEVPGAAPDPEEEERRRRLAEAQEFVRSLLGSTTARDATHVPHFSGGGRDGFAALAALIDAIAERGRERREFLEREGVLSGHGVLGLLAPIPAVARAVGAGARALGVGRRASPASRALAVTERSPEAAQGSRRLSKTLDALDRATGGLGGSQGSTERALRSRLDEAIAGPIVSIVRDEMLEETRRMGEELGRKIARELAEGEKEQ